MKTALRPMVLLLLTNAALAQEKSVVFRDDLMDHLVGRWNVTGLVHGEPSKQKLEAEWVLNHQFLRVTEKSVGNVGGEDFPFEGVFYFGYDKTGKHYVVHLMTVSGGDSDSLGIGERKGNELVVTFPYAYGPITHRFSWKPATKSWHIVVQEGKTPPHIDLKATSAR